jgi:hypothetical protein
VEVLVALVLVVFLSMASASTLTAVRGAHARALRLEESALLLRTLQSRHLLGLAGEGSADASPSDWSVASAVADGPDDATAWRTWTLSPSDRPSLVVSLELAAPPL